MRENIFYFKTKSRNHLFRIFFVLIFFSLLRRFSPSKFHFDFEDDLPQGLLRLGFVAFLNQNFILMSKTTCPRDCVAFGFFRFPLLINASSFFSKKIRDWDCFASLMIPLFAKNSRLGYFF